MGIINFNIEMSAVIASEAAATAIEESAWSPWPFTVAWLEANTIWVVGWVIAFILDIVWVVYVGGLFYFEYDKENLLGTVRSSNKKDNSGDFTDDGGWQSADDGFNF